MLYIHLILHLKTAGVSFLKQSYSKNKACELEGYASECFVVKRYVIES